MTARSARLATSFVCALAALATAGTGTARADTGAAPGRLSDSTTVGVHNAYERGTHTYLADALDSGAGLLELDVWTDGLTRRWRVSHSNPFGNDNNCTDTADPDELRDRPRNQDLGRCLDNIRAWHDAHPGHRPIIFKLEMKDGFEGNHGLGPEVFDRLVTDRLGDALYRPADLLARPGGGAYGTLDEAARTGDWAARDALAGKVLLEVTPGTFEKANPFDRLWTDAEYAGHLRDLAAAGNISRATAFPAVLDAAPGDPRTRYRDASLRPWFVLFDGAASDYTAGGIDTAWYAARNYLLVMTGAHSVAPAIDPRNPTPAEALDRVKRLAAVHASVVTSDWTPATGVLGTVLPRADG